MRSIAIGLLGAGNVGAGALRILEENGAAIAQRLGAAVKVTKVLVRNPDAPRQHPIPAGVLTTVAEDVLHDPDIRVVVELIGGTDPARPYVIEALRCGKHVVTANKALLSEHGEEIFGEARKRGLSVYFEGAVAGGIPVLRSLREGLASDRIQRVTGIVNGTSNYVLDAMTRSGLDYDAAVVSAQQAGYAEADPTLDVGGMDAAHKLALLTLVCCGVRCDPEAIPTEGITRVRPFDIEMAEELGYVIKSLAIGDFGDDGPMLRVHPAFVPKNHILAGVQGPYNAVLAESAALGRSLYYGQGAGMMPTGVAVVSDILEVCRDLAAFVDSGPPPEASRDVISRAPAAFDDFECENYLCVHVPNVPGVLGRVASCLGEHGVSIKRMNQDTPGPGEQIDMVILTEHVAESKMAAAIAALDKLPGLMGPTDRIRILDAEAE